MKKIKDFFDKKQNELKFKNAGAGHKLSGAANKPPNRPTPSASSSSSTSVPVAPVRRTGPDANVASAALARFGGKSTSKPTTMTTLHDIMTEERKKITEEMKLKEEAEVYIAGSPMESPYIFMIYFHFRNVKRNKLICLRNKRIRSNSLRTLNCLRALHLISIHL